MIASLFTVLTLLLPWSRAGETQRSGFALARAVDQAGLASSGWLRLLLYLVIASPVFVGITYAAVLIGSRRTATFLTALGGLIILVASLVVFVQFGGPAETGPLVGAVLGGLSIVCAVSDVVLSGQARVRKL